jgi:hypothetical protein
MVATFTATLIFLALALYLRQTTPGEENRFLPQCLFHLATGWHCPGCGNTRATWSLLHGDIGAAARQNALFVATLPLMLYGGFRVWHRWLWGGHRFRPIPWQAWHGWLIVAVILVFSVLRNLPRQPFAWLAPNVAASAEREEG